MFLVLDNVALIAADTTRSRAYLQSLIRHQLLPNFVLLLEHEAANVLPGQIKANEAVNPPVVIVDNEDDWSESNFAPTLPIRDLLDIHAIPYAVAPNMDINDSAVIDEIARRGEAVFIYSGFGGVLLRKDLLSCGKKFLHVHGGYLPDYKGSTTNYFSLLVEKKMGASSMFLSEEIDSGPVLIRREFSVPPDKLEIDHRYDSAARAKVLVDTLVRYIRSGQWEFELPNNLGGETYYIIHPVLKHIAILAKDN